MEKLFHENGVMIRIEGFNIEKLTEKFHDLEGKLLLEVNQNPQLIKDDGWRVLESNFSSTKTLCNKLTDTLQHLRCQFHNYMSIKNIKETVAAKWLEVESFSSDLPETNLKDDDHKILRNSMTNLDKEKSEPLSSNKEFEKTLDIALHEIKDLENLINSIDVKLSELEKQKCSFLEKVTHLNTLFDYCFKIAQKKRNEETSGTSMTSVMGIRCGDSIYAGADGRVVDVYTGFANVIVVQENHAKLCLAGPYIIGYSGSIVEIQSISEILENELEAGNSPASQIDNLSPDKALCVGIFGFQGGEPCMLISNPKYARYDEFTNGDGVQVSTCFMGSGTEYMKAKFDDIKVNLGMVNEANLEFYVKACVIHSCLREEGSGGYLTFAQSNQQTDFIPRMDDNPLHIIQILQEDFPRYSSVLKLDSYLLLRVDKAQAKSFDKDTSWDNLKRNFSLTSIKIFYCPSSEQPESNFFVLIIGCEDPVAKNLLKDKYNEKVKSMVKETLMNHIIVEPINLPDIKVQNLEDVSEQNLRSLLPREGVEGQVEGVAGQVDHVAAIEVEEDATTPVVDDFHELPQTTSDFLSELWGVPK